MMNFQLCLFPFVCPSSTQTPDVICFVVSIVSLEGTSHPEALHSCHWREIEQTG